MAREQYLFSDKGRWIGASGNAAFLIVNRNGSGKTVFLNELAIRNATPLATGPAATFAALFALAYCSAPAGGHVVTPTSMDTNAVLPPQVKVVSGGTATVGAVMRRQSFAKGVLSTGTAGFVNRKASGPSRGLGLRRRKAPTNEFVTLNPGETLGLIPTFLQAGQLIRTTIEFVVHSVPKRTWAAFFIGEAHNVNNTICQLRNEAGSGVKVSLIDIFVEEVGTFDTPYFQVVPVGGLESAFLDDVTARFPTVAMDTNYGPLDPAKVAVLADVPILPLGVPVQYFSEGSAGSPKGVSYLQTKDFLGPVYRVMFPEFIAYHSAGGTPDDRGLTMAPKRAGLGMQRSKITIREGEGVAIVSSAETALNVNTVGVSGWGIFEISGRITLEASTKVSVSGLVSGSRLKATKASNGDVLFNGAEISGTVNFDTDYVGLINIEARKATASPFYIPWVTQITTISGQTVGATALQQLDE
jgi:hypothetical protein